jgi:hypothetical protein
VVDGYGDDVFGSETLDLRGFFEAVVAVGRGEEGEFVGTETVVFCGWVEGVAGDCYGGCVWIGGWELVDVLFMRRGGVGEEGGGGKVCLCSGRVFKMMGGVLESRCYLM